MSVTEFMVTFRRNSFS